MHLRFTPFHGHSPIALPMVIIQLKGCSFSSKGQATLTLNPLQEGKINLPPDIKANMSAIPVGLNF